jgi:hypothetical protein
MDVVLVVCAAVTLAGAVLVGLFLPARAARPAAPPAEPRLVSVS